MTVPTRSPSPAAFALLLLAAALLWPANAVRAQQEFQTPAGVTLMTEAEILAALPGNTLAGVSRGTDWAEHYDPSGNIRGLWGRTPKHLYDARWKVEGSVLCLTYTYEEDSGCFTLARDNDTIFFFNLNGSPGKYPQATLKPGNPEGL